MSAFNTHNVFVAPGRTNASSGSGAYADSDLRVRFAAPSDAGAIARIHVETWRAAYRGIISDAHLDSLSIDGRAVGWEKNLRANPASTLVAVVAGELLGWVHFGRTRDPSAVGADEIFAIYVDAAHLHRGLGSALLQAAEEEITNSPERGTNCRILLWVLESNHAARRFYEGFGYSANGRQKKEVIGDQIVVELQYEKSVASHAGI